MNARVFVEGVGPVRRVLLDQPERHNVLDLGGWRALAEAFRGLAANGEVHCVIVSGLGGRAFSAGSDIGAFGEQRTEPEDVRDYSRAIADALEAIRCCPHPVVAAIQGICVGGGLEIASCCDVRVCGEGSRFGAPIARLGVTMAPEELAPIVELVGPGHASRLLFTGDLVGADEARAMGLVNSVFPDDEVVASGMALAERIATGAPLVHRWHKRLIGRLRSAEPITEEERAEALDTFATDDYREGVVAFLEKRSPKFRGE